jgi:CheY-like chemotaxis protein
MKVKHVDLILLNLDQRGGKGWRVAQRIRTESGDARAICPHMIVTSVSPSTLADAVKCRNLDAVVHARAILRSHL